MNISQKVAKILLEVKAVTLSPKKPYRFTTGILSPVYVDNRILMSFPKERKIIRNLYVESIRNSKMEVDLIAATATAGIPHGAWVADKLNLPMVYVRKEAKGHGKQNQIEGIVKKGQVAVVIEDLISTGESSVNTARAVKQAGAKVNHIFSIITYGMKKSQQNFENNKLKLISLTTFKDLVIQAEKMDYITRGEMSVILDWAKDPPSWGHKMGFE